MKNNDCIILNKCIYGLVQAAQQYYKKAVEILKSSGFVGGSIDPCLYVKRSAKGVVHVALYRDNMFSYGGFSNSDQLLITF